MERSRVDRVHAPALHRCGLGVGFLGNDLGGALLASSAYYSVYETLHWCMHQPGERSVERTGLFFRLNGHHLLHHRYMRKNFNVVLPLADLCLGTLLLRSKVRFAQATGPTVPDVQPRNIVPFVTRDKHATPGHE